MNKNIVALAMIGGLVSLGLVGCSSADPNIEPTITAEPGVAAGPVDVSNIEGRTLELNVGDFSEINVGDSDPTLWTAKVSKEGIAEFIPGEDDGTTVWQPGISATAPGTTDMEVTDGEETIKFKVVVLK